MAGKRLLVFGSINIDLVCRVTSIPRPGETVLSPRFEQFNGGKGANQAVAAARCLGSDGTVAMGGAVGDDDFGRSATANLNVEDIDTGMVEIVDEPTGCAFITVDSAGENAITVASGANMRVACPNAADVDVAVMQMETPAEQNLAFAQAARDQGATVILNFAPASASIEPDLLRRLLECTTYLVVNEIELATVAKLLGASADAEPTAMAQVLSGAAKLSVVATLGAQGALLASAGSSVESIAAPPCDVVDTTGAGDTLVGAFGAFLCLGQQAPEALRLAVAAASLACEKHGAQSAMPRRAAVMALASSAQSGE